MFSILTVGGRFICGCACWNTSRDYAVMMSRIMG